MDKIANTLTIDIYAKASCPDAEYSVGIDDVGQITITPVDANCNFTSVSRELEEGAISIHLTANMISSDDNFNYFLDIDEIGQIVVTPDSENSSFESAAEGADLNLVTESHFRVVTEGEELAEDIDSESEPYTYEQVEADLKSLTMNWTREDTLKTGFEIEHQYAMEILSKHYDTVYDEGHKGNWYYVRFVGPMLTESVNFDDKIADIKDRIDYYNKQLELCRDDSDRKDMESKLKGFYNQLNYYTKLQHNGGNLEMSDLELELTEDLKFVWAGKYYDKDGNKKFVCLSKDVSRDAEEASEYMEDAIPEPFTKFVFLGTYSEKDATSMGCTLLENLTEGRNEYFTSDDVLAVREKFRKWGFKVDALHPGFDRYTCKVNDYLLECVFDHKFGSPDEKCFTARVLLNRKTMDYFFTAEDALDFMLANAENRVLDESVSIHESNENEEDQFLLYFPHIGGPKVVSKERAIKQLELELDTIKNESGASVAGRGFGLYCLQSIDSESGTVWQGRYDSKEFLKVLNESISYDKPLADADKERVNYLLTEIRDYINENRYAPAVDALGELQEILRNNYTESLNEGDDNRAKDAFMNMFGDVEKQLDDLMGKWEDLKKNLEQQKREGAKPLEESKQGECEKCGHTLTDGGECPVCDLGDEEERTSHTLYEGLSFKEGDVLEYSGLFGGSYTSRITKIEGSKMWVDTSWTAEESGEEVHDEDTFFIVKDDEGNDCIEVYHYQGEVGRVYPPATKVNESYWINNKDIMSEVSNLGKQLEADGYKYYGDRDAGGTYFDFYTKPGDNGADCKAVRYNYQGAAIVDITVDQLIGKEPLTQFDGLRRKLGKMLLPEAMSGTDAMEMLRIAKEIGIQNGEDLIRFYKDHPAADEDKLATIQSYRNELGPDFKLEEGTRVSFDLDGKNYRGTYRGQSTTDPDMADVELDDDCYENPDPYGRYINRRPIYNRHEDRYIKDGKFFIPRSELKFLDENRRTRKVDRSIDEIAELLGGYEFMRNTIEYIIEGHLGVEDDNETIAEMIFDSETPVSYEELLSLVEYLNN